jgi:hypothetical protein
MTSTAQTAKERRGTLRLALLFRRIAAASNVTRFNTFSMDLAPT